MWYDLQLFHNLFFNSLITIKNCERTPDEEYNIGGRATCYKVEKAGKFHNKINQQLNQL